MHNIELCGTGSKLHWVVYVTGALLRSVPLTSSARFDGWIFSFLFRRALFRCPTYFCRAFFLICGLACKYCVRLWTCDLCETNNLLLMLYFLEKLRHRFPPGNAVHIWYHIWSFCICICILLSAEMPAGFQYDPLSLYVFVLSVRFFICPISVSDITSGLDVMPVICQRETICCCQSGIIFTIWIPIF